MEKHELTVITNEGKEVFAIDSREVAEMLGKEHKELLRDIEGGAKAVGIIPVLESGNFPLSNYFIPSTYKAGTREYKCYLVTKMGCELLGNKQQGEKGILFSAKYVTRFNEMEEHIKNYNGLTNISSIISSIDSLRDELSSMENRLASVEESNKDVVNRVTFKDSDTKWIVKSIKRYLGIKTKGQNLFEYERLINYYILTCAKELKLPITKLEDIPKSIESMRILDNVLNEYHPSNQRRLF